MAEPRLVATDDPPPLGVWVIYGFLTVCLVAYVISELVRREGQSWLWLDGWTIAGFELVLSLLCISRAIFAKSQRLVPLVLGLSLEHSGSARLPRAAPKPARARETAKADQAGQWSYEPAPFRSNS